MFLKKTVFSVFENTAAWYSKIHQKLQIKFIKKTAKILNKTNINHKELFSKSYKFWTIKIFKIKKTQEIELLNNNTLLAAHVSYITKNNEN